MAESSRLATPQHRQGRSSRTTNHPSPRPSRQREGPQRRQQDKEIPTADCSGGRQVDGTTGQTVVGTARAGRSTSSACMRSGRRPAEPIRDSEFASHQKSECTGAIFSSCHSKLRAWQTGGVHLRPGQVTLKRAKEQRMAVLCRTADWQAALGSLRLVPSHTMQLLFVWRAQRNP
jgi:hypothetical protein